MDLQTWFTGLDELYRSGNAGQAEAYLRSGLARAQAEHDSPAVISISNELGGLYRVQGRFEAGITCFQNALNCIGTSPFTGTKGHGTTLLNYATLLTAMGDTTGAARRFSEAVRIFEQSESVEPYRLAALYNNLATLRLRLEQYEEGLACTDQALTLLRSLPGSGDEAGVTHTVRAQLLARTGRSYTALHELALAEQAFRQCPDASPVHKAAMEQFLGELRLARQEWQEALSAYDRAEALLQDGNGAWQSLALLYRRQAVCCRNLDHEEEATALEARAAALEEGGISS